MKNNNNAPKKGLGISSVLTLIFVVLKLAGLIEWSWVWVLSPLWIAFTVWFIVLALVFLVILILKTIKE